MWTRILVDCYNEKLSRTKTPPNESPNLKNSDQVMDIEGLTTWMPPQHCSGKRKQKTTKMKARSPLDLATPFAICPPSCEWLLLTIFSHPDLPLSHGHPSRSITPSPSNATDAMFDALDEFLTKMKEVDCHFTVFPLNLLKYGTLLNLPYLIDNLDDLPK